MDDKITLNLNKAIVEKATKYAKAQNTSLSKMIESYLASVIENEEKENQNTPLVQSLLGVINLEQDYDYKKSYANYLLINKSENRM
jgi:hypothetical protein